MTEPFLDPWNEAHAKAEVRLRIELIAWLTTVTPEGQPQSTPVWFWWDGGTFLLYSQPNAPKLANLAANPRVSLHLGDDGWGGDVVAFEGTAELADGPPADEVGEYIEKYRERIEGYDWTPASFASDYSQAIRITPTRARIW